jgi:ATP-dependent Clp protease protease subunit
MKSALKKKEPVKIIPLESESAGIYLLFGEINTDSIEKACGWILSENVSDNPPEYINLIINSPGGSLTDAFALISIMGSSVIPIRTVGLGEVSSAGLFIFMAGTKGMRTIDPNAEIMSHHFSTGHSGTFHELKNLDKQYNAIDKRIVQHYKKFTGLEEKVIREKLLSHQDIYLTAKDCVQLGIADEIGGI